MTPSPVSLPPAFSTTCLDDDLQQRLAEAAGREGMSFSSLCERWLLEALQRHEQAHGVEGAGRCSVRTGQSTLGPVPLPLQQ
ncbi:MAG: CopG family transcriptional regulator [Synechococcaceae cyanobacterium]